MSIQDEWLAQFKAVVMSEIELAGGRAADGYRAVSSKTGLGYDYIYQIYKGKPAHKPKRPSAEAMDSIGRAYGAGLSDLPQSLHTAAPPTAKPRLMPTPIALENNPDYPAVRRVQFKLSAGATGFGVEYREEDGAPIVFQRQWYEGRGLRPEKLFAIKVANHSMEPGLFDGDTVVVNTDSVTPKDGVVFAVNYEGEMVIKRLSRDGGQWWLCSDNPDQRRYPRKVCDEHSIIIGEIVHKQSERI